MTNIVVTKLSSGVITSNVPVTLKNNPVLSSGNVNIYEGNVTINNANLAVESLTNVVSNNEITGGTLVYNASTNTWNAQLLNLSYTTGSLDGGTF